MNKFFNLNTLKQCNRALNSARSYNHLIRNVQPLKESTYFYAASLNPLFKSNIHTSCLLFNSKPNVEVNSEIPTEKIVGTAQKFEFLAETKQLLNIVAKSLYSEKEVFVRFELINKKLK